MMSVDRSPHDIIGGQHGRGQTNRVPDLHRTRHGAVPLNSPFRQADGPTESGSTDGYCSVAVDKRSKCTDTPRMHVSRRRSTLPRIQRRRVSFHYSSSFATIFNTSSKFFPAFSGDFLILAQTSPCLGSFRTHLATTSLRFSSVPCWTKNLYHQAQVSP